MHPAERLRQLAGAQHGVVLRSQLAGLGVDRAALRRFRSGGWVVPLRRGAWLVAASPDPSHHAAAAVLLAEPGAWLSHWSAASFHRLPHVVPGPDLELTVLGSRYVRMQGVSTHYVPVLEPPDSQVVRGLPMTSPARTLIDVAPRLPAGLVERVVDEGVVSRLWTPETLCSALERAPASSDTTALRAVLDDRLGRSGGTVPWRRGPCGYSTASAHSRSTSK
jgi:hypothetical protein